MSGRKKQELRGIFDKLNNSYKAQLQVYYKKLRDLEHEEMEAIAAEVEEFLGTEGIELTDDKRLEIMNMIYGFLENIDLLNDECDLLEAQLEQALLDLNVKDKLLELQQQLIEMYQKMSSAQETEKQELLDQIDVLRRQIDELNAAKSQRQKKTSGSKTAKEKKEDLKKRLRRLEERKKKMEEELDKLDSTTEEDASDIPNVDAFEADEISQQQDDAPDPPTSPDPPDTVDSPTDEAESLPDPDSSQHSTLTPEGSSQSEEEVDSLEKRIEELEQKLENYEKLYSEAHSKAERSSKDSNTPSGKSSPWKEYKTSKARKSKADGSADEGQSEKNEGGSDEDEELKAVFDEDAEASDAAVHDPRKSLNNQVGETHKPRGKKTGSPGGGRDMPNYDEEREIKCPPHRCEHCPNRETCEALHAAKDFGQIRYKYDIEIRRIATRYRTQRCVCPNDGETLCGEYPEGINNRFVYGEHLRTLGVSLNTVGMVSYERIADILRGMLDDEKLSDETVMNWVKVAVENVKKATRYIKAGVFSGDYMNNDESSVKVKGILHWVHTACNMAFTYMRVDKQRGHDAMRRIGVLPGYMGTIITDCLASYWGMGSRHALCNAHLLRELLALVKFFERDKEWAQKLMDLMIEMKDERDKLKNADVKAFSKEQIENYRKRYKDIVEEGLKIHPDSELLIPPRGKPRKCRGRNLLDRLNEHMDNFLLFLEDFNVPFTNNSAEKSLRLFSIKRSVVGSFDTYEGADGFALIWSYIATARKRDLNLYDAIEAVVKDKAVEYLFDDEEIQALEKASENLDEINRKHFLEDRAADKKEIDEARATILAKQRGYSAAVDKVIINQEKLLRAKERMEADLNALITAPQNGLDRAKKALAISTKRVERLIQATQKSIATAAKKEAAFVEAFHQGQQELQNARWRAEAALFFLEVKDLDWDFDKAMAS